MTRHWLITIGCMVLLALSACSKSSSTAAPPETPAPQAQAVESVQAQPESQDTASLAGTSWQWGDYEVTFKDATSFHIQGGELRDMAPDGVAGTYAIEDGDVGTKALTFTVLDQIKTGTWDGENLVVEKEAAVRQ